MHSRILALAALLGACTGTGGQVPAPVAKPVAISTPVVTPSPAPVVARPAAPRRPFVFLRPFDGGAQAELWLPGEPPRALGVHAEFGGGEAGVGSGSPRLSPDGSWLAFIVKNGSTLTLRRVDGTREAIVATYPTDSVELLISGWAPDGQSLLYHLGEVDDDEGTRLPRGALAGFYRVQLADLKPTRVPGLAAFEAWLADGSGVIYQREVDREGTFSALMRVELAPAAKPISLYEIDAPFGFGQLTLRGDEVVFVHDAAIVRSKLDGSGRESLTPRGQFAQYQRPRRSPDGERLAYLDERTIKVITLEQKEPMTVLTCEARRCEYAWESDDSLLVVDSGELRRVGLDGAATPIADRVLGFAVAGQ